MSPEAVVATIGSVMAGLGVAFAVFKRLPKRVSRGRTTVKWREIQRMCSDKKLWPDAVCRADDLLDSVLRRKRKEGKTMGERLVSAQKLFTNNDAVWQAHKLANHVRHSYDNPRLKETDVKRALVAFREALRDLGAV